MTKSKKVILAGMFLGLCFVLPFFTAQIKTVGKALAPMHIPVLLCGFICGIGYAAAVGAIAPIMRSAIFGMPVMFPSALAMAFELATYGAVVALMNRLLPKKPWAVYVSTVTAMICGRAVWGAVRYVFAFASGSSFGFEAFISGAVLESVPGIILQIVIVPALILILRRAKLIER